MSREKDKSHEAPAVDPIENLVKQFARLPGIGPKSARRLTYHLLQGKIELALNLSDALRSVATSIKLCSICCLPTQVDPCKFCSDARRDDSLLCVVERPQDLEAVEACGEYRGRYHILHGRIAPLEGMTPDELKIGELISRLANSTVEEVIIATNPNKEGEVTAIYLSKLIKPMGIKVSRIASGVPMGGELEYTDKITLSRALSARREL